MPGTYKKEIYAEKPDLPANYNVNREKENIECDLTESNKIYMLCEEMIKSYNSDRIKTLNLLKAWRKFYKEDKEE